MSEEGQLIGAFFDLFGDGFARAMVPAHTMGDGDTIFAIATGRPNIPAVRDLRRP